MCCLWKPDEKLRAPFICGLDAGEDFNPDCANNGAERSSKTVKMAFVRHMAVSRGMIARSTAKCWIISIVLAALAAFPASLVAQTQNDTPALKKIVVVDSSRLIL
jgi:hypothetical protein